VCVRTCVRGPVLMNEWGSVFGGDRLRQLTGCGNMYMILYFF
jgi:hypothetical protein